MIKALIIWKACSTRAEFLAAIGRSDFNTVYALYTVAYGQSEVIASDCLEFLQAGV